MYEFLYVCIIRIYIYSMALNLILVPRIQWAFPLLVCLVVWASVWMSVCVRLRDGTFNAAMCVCVSRNEVMCVCIEREDSCVSFNEFFFCRTRQPMMRCGVVCVCVCVRVCRRRHVQWGCQRSSHSHRQTKDTTRWERESERGDRALRQRECVGRRHTRAHTHTRCVCMNTWLQIKYSVL
jgi:hypothetical protein